jgi:hypothetical protein
MSDAQIQAALEPQTQVPPPKSDAEAARQAAAQPAHAEPETEDPAKVAEEAAKKEKNRTREYINKLNRDNGALRARLEAAERAMAERQGNAAPTQQRPAQAPQTPNAGADPKPTLASCNYDLEVHAERIADWKVRQARAEWQAEVQKHAETSQKQTTWQSYETKAAAFTEAHPDFPEVVSSIKYPLSETLQAAIAAHPQGPEIAYHLGQNDDDAFQLAGIQPHLISAAVDRIASRLTGPRPSNAALAAIPPVTKAPNPPPRVGTRAPTSVPPEKMTDDQWFAQRKAKGKG